MVNNVLSKQKQKNEQKKDIYDSQNTCPLYSEYEASVGGAALASLALKQF